MAAVRTEDKVLGVERRCLADRSRFLAHGKVRRSAVVVRNSVPRAGFFERIDHVLELADCDHVVQHCDKSLFPKGFELVRKVPLVLIYRNRRQGQGSALADRCRVNKQ